MAINDLPYNNAESFQYLDQSSRPDSVYERIPPFTVQDDAYLEQEDEQNEFDGHIIGALKECLEEIDIKGKELFNKIFSEKDVVEIPLGRLAREAIGDSRAKDFLGKIFAKVVDKMKVEKDEDIEMADRGVSIDEELNQKLERFKVKTVNIGATVSDDKK